MAVHGQADGDGLSLLRQDVRDEKHGADAHRLLRQLGECGNLCPLQTVVAAVDAGVNGGAGHRESHDRQQQGAAGLQKDVLRQEWGEPADGRRQNQGHGQGDQESGSEDGFSLLDVGGHKAGDGCLDGSGTEGEADAEDGMDHVVDAQSLRADGSRQIDAVEEAQDAAGKSGSGEHEGSGDKGPPAGGDIHRSPQKYS